MRTILTILIFSQTFLGISVAQTKSTRKITIEVFDRSDNMPLSDYLLVIFNENNDTIFNRQIRDTSDNILELKVNHVYSIHIRDRYVLQTFRTGVDLTDTTKNLEYWKRIGIPRRETLNLKGYISGLRIYLDQPFIYFSDNSIVIKNNADSSISKYVKTCQEFAKETGYNKKIEYRLYCSQTPFEAKGTAQKRGEAIKSVLLKSGISADKIFINEKNDPDFNSIYKKLKLKEDKEVYKARNRYVTLICVGE